MSVIPQLGGREVVGAHSDLGVDSDVSPDAQAELIHPHLDSQQHSPLEALRQFIGSATFVMNGIPLSAVESTAVILPDTSSSENTGLSNIMGQVPEVRRVTQVPFLRPDVVIAQLHVFGSTGDPGKLTRATIAQAFERPMISETKDDKVIFYFDTFTKPVVDNEPLFHILNLFGDNGHSKEPLKVKHDKNTDCVVMILDEKKFFQSKGLHPEDKLIMPKYLYTGPFENNNRIAIQAGFSDMPMGKVFVRDFFNFTNGLTRQLERFAVALESGEIVTPDDYIKNLVAEAQGILYQDLGNRIMNSLGNSHFLMASLPIEEMTKLGLEIHRSTTTERDIYLLMYNLQFLLPIMQTIDLAEELGGVRRILSFVHNLTDDRGKVVREFTFEIAEEAEFTLRAMPNILSTMLYTLVNKIYLDHKATQAHVLLEKKGDSIVLSLKSDMEESQIYPSLLTKDILSLLLIFSAICQVPPSEVGHQADESTIQFIFPAVYTLSN